MRKYILKQIFIVLSLPLLFACTGEKSNPELLDPIYQDFVKEVAVYTKVIEEAQKTLDATRAELDGAAPHSLDRKLKLRALEKGALDVADAKQKLVYFKIRADLRKAYGRKDYRAAFKEGRPWPDPKEYEAYKTNRGLVNADRSWSRRVPKTVHQELSADAMKRAPGE